MYHISFNVTKQNINNLKHTLGLLESNPSEMDGYISTILLISVALTFHGTGAHNHVPCSKLGCHHTWSYPCSSPGNDQSCNWRRLCIAICEAPEKTTRLNCCRGNSGTYPTIGGPNGYDNHMNANQ